MHETASSAGGTINAYYNSRAMHPEMRTSTMAFSGLVLYTMHSTGGFDSACFNNIGSPQFFEETRQQAKIFCENDQEVVKDTSSKSSNCAPFAVTVKSILAPVTPAGAAVVVI